MSEQIIKRQYIALAKVLKFYQADNLDKQLLRLSLSFCKSLYELAESNPDLVFAQPQLYKRNLSYGLNITFNACVMTCLVCIRNRYSLPTTLQIMSGSISMYGFEQDKLNYYAQHSDSTSPPTLGQINRDFCKLLKKHQQDSWLAAYKMSPLIHRQSAPKHHTINAITIISYIANKLALKCTPNKRIKSLTFSQVLKWLTLNLSPHYYALLTPLLEYPSYIPPGSFVKDNKNSLQIIVAMENQTYITQAVPSKQSGSTPSAIANVQLTDKQNITYIYPNQTINSLSQINIWWNDTFQQQVNELGIAPVSPWQRLLAVQQPPASLLVIQDQLKQSKINNQLIVKAIEKEPSYRQYLIELATRINRKKNTVQTIQHSLAMLGHERASSHLLDHSLLARLNQQCFPLQPTIINYSQFYILVVRQLATKSNVATPDTAGIAARFFISPLLTTSSFKTKLTLPTVTSFRYKLSSLIESTKNENYDLLSASLAKAWQQDELILQSLFTQSGSTNKVKRQVSQLRDLLEAGLVITSELYFAQLKACSESNHYIHSAQKSLGIQSDEWDQMKNELAINSHLYCELA